MAEPGGSRSGWTILRTLFGVMGVVAFVLGLVGLRRLDDAAGSWGDTIYYTLQLYVLGSDPLQPPHGEVSAPLQAARFMAPLFTLATVVETGRLLLAGELRKFRSRTARRHAVVCGDTPFAQALADQLFATGHRVVVVRSAPFGPLELRHRRLLGVAGDARTAAVLRAAGLRRARYLYVCGDDDQVNHRVSVTAGTELQLRRSSPRIYVQLNRQQTCHSLQARRLGAAGTNRFRLDYFHVDDIAARTLYLRHPLDPPSSGAAPVRLLISGEGSFARVLLVETARYWRAVGGARDQLHVDVIGADAGRTVATLQARFPFLESACRVRAHNELLDTWLPRITRPARYERIYLCHRDEQRMLDLALESPQLWQAVGEAVFVATYQASALAEAFHGGEHNDLLDEVGGKLVMYPIITRACDANLIADDLTERLARRFHQRYLDVVPAAPGSVSGVAWSQLPESMRNANRAQVQGIAAKMQALGCVIAVRNGEDGLITERELELLAELEHRRWCAERRGRGWRHGERRDDRRRTHPDLVDWSELGEASRDKARDAVRYMSEMLADEGFTIVRLNEEPIGATAV
ncbi:RyR domain-containing protein [Dactylosporangium sp. CA-139066]|uniref:RyR domain-containing protein n=1 Tax=Dactylosporangium sp. CA-139066 TaxID=3239930 RepID=UPI003D8D3EA5